MAKHRTTYRKVITSQELIDQIHPQNKMLMERFLKNFATKRSPKSVKVYRSNLNIFMCWNVEHNMNKPFVKIRKIEMLDFFDYALSELKWSPNRFAQMHSSLSSFSDWIENFLDDDDEFKDFRNIVKKVEKPVKEAVRVKTVLQKDDIDKLMKYLEEKNRIQDQCLLALAISCGARVSELASFTTDIIDENNTAFDDLFLETLKQIKTKGRGVNGKMLTKYILKDIFLPYYKKWLVERERIMKETGQNHDFIFITKQGVPATAERLRDWMSNWSDIVDRPCYPHNFRHYNISFLKSLDLEDDFIVYITGWSESTGHTMVSIYDDRSKSSRKWKNLDKLKAALQ